MTTLRIATPIALYAAACACASDPLAAHAATAPAHGTGEQVTEISANAMPNLPGKSLVAVQVDYAPGGRSLPHRHAPSAFIYGYVVSGSIRSQVAGGQPHVYKAGESFVEEPGAHHVLGENASRTDPARLLAVFIVDTDHGRLTMPDRPDGRP